MTVAGWGGVGWFRLTYVTAHCLPVSVKPNGRSKQAKYLNRLGGFPNFTPACIYTSVLEAVSGYLPIDIVNYELPIVTPKQNDPSRFSYS